MHIITAMRFFIIGAITMTAAVPIYANKNISPLSEGNESISPLPEYVVYDPAKDTDAPKILRTIAKPLSFPLTAEDKRDISLLTAKFDGEKKCAGLAAPQIGISKPIIIFFVPDNDAELKTRRPDLTDTMLKTVWINPKYEGIESFGYNEDYEACFSVKDYAGPVTRYKKIHYEAYTATGQWVNGTAEGFLARVIQHETDHTKGILWIDKTDLSRIMLIDEYRRIKQSEQKDQQAKANKNNKEDL